MGARASLVLIGLAFCASGGVSAQTSSATPNRRIEGDWVRVDYEGSGSFDGLNSKVAPAQLLPGVSMPGRGGGRGGRGARGGAPAANNGPNPVGVPYIVVPQPCGGGGGGRGNGALLTNPDSGGIHFVEHKDEVIMAGERGGVRHIYLDGRPHPSVGNRTPTGAGHSVGHYEGDVLVVDTTDLTQGTVVAGGIRSPETHLGERFEVSPDGKRLTITYTWDDPKIYAKPHTYKYIFDRAPEIGGVSYALEEWCDAGDPVEQQSIVPPKQLP